MKKVRDHCYYTGKYRGAAHSNCNLNYKMPKEILVVFHNGSTYDYHFIIKQFARKFKGYFDCLGENTENTLLFMYQLKKKMTMVKELHTSQNLLIVTDSCRIHYQILLIIYQRLVIKNLKINLQIT